MHGNQSAVSGAQARGADSNEGKDNMPVWENAPLSCTVYMRTTTNTVRGDWKHEGYFHLYRIDETYPKDVIHLSATIHFALCLLVGSSMDTFMWL